jgi:hypothetical protein
MLDTSHPDILYLREQRCEDLIFSKPEGFREQINLENTSLVGIVTKLWAGGSRVRFRTGTEVFISKTSRLALGTTYSDTSANE